MNDNVGPSSVMEIAMTDYAIDAWIAIVVIVLSIWRAFHGPYSDEWWKATTHWLRRRIRVHD